MPELLPQLFRLYSAVRRDTKLAVATYLQTLLIRLASLDPQFLGSAEIAQTHSRALFTGALAVLSEPLMSARGPCEMGWCASVSSHHAAPLPPAQARI